jgi:hypothetical protein
MTGRALVLACLVTGAGCAPLATLRPAAPLLCGRTFEVGAGVVALSSKPYAPEPWRGAAHLWLDGRVTRWLDVGGVASADLSGAAAGATARAHLVTTGRFALSADAELGWAWGALAVPVAVRLFDETWLYAAPRFGNFGGRPTLGIPAGLSVRITGATFVRVEAQVSWPDLSPYERRVHVALAVARQL